MSKTFYGAVLESDLTDELTELREVLRIAKVFNIDNVSRYFYSDMRASWDWKRDFPNIAPPFPAFWLEYTIPNEIWGFRSAFAGASVGLLFSTCEPEGEDAIDSARWLMSAYPFMRQGSRIVRVPIDWHMAIDTDGAVINRGNPNEDKRTATIYLKQGMDPKLIGISQMFIIEPCLLAISLMHCKNVELIENVPPALPMTKKRAQHPPRTKYYTLNIRPMQRILEDEGHASKTGLKLALHICRGHFKDFSKGNGLFGKYKGLYWWDSQVRGNKQYGEVQKDYNVNLPKQQGE